MDVIKELHAEVAAACEASFDKAYARLKFNLDAYAKEAEVRESLARQSQLQAENRIRELQNDIAVLHNELQRYEVDPRDLELPERYANLEIEFDPKNLWGGDLEDDKYNAQKFRDRVEAKYTALYTNLQTFIQTWSGLKSRVLQHKRKLRLWDQQLEREEFSLVVNGKPVRFRKVLCPTSEDADDGYAQPTQASSRKRPRKKYSDRPDKASKSSHTRTCADKVDTVVKVEGDRRSTHDPTSEAISTQSGSPRSALEASQFPEMTSPPPNSLLQQTRQRLSPPASEFLPPIPAKTLAHSQHIDRISERPAVVKTETLSSSPIRSSIRQDEQPFVSTQDLDEIGYTIRTPMKRKAYRDAQAANDWDSKRSTDHAGHSKRISSNKPPFQQSSILRPVDGNARMGTLTASPSTKRLEDLERRAIPDLAEDGDDTPSVEVFSDVLIGRSCAKTYGGRAQRRLENLLQKPVPPKSPLHNSTEISTWVTRKANATFDSGQAKSQNASQLAPVIDPDDEPFRSRPLRCLGLEHFKINPARNQGLDYAYDTVVRKKDDRKCLSGCTRPGCCGDRFRAMARLGGIPGKSGDEQQEEDQAILEEFVGDDTQLLGTLTGEERERLLVEARARALANQYGRHRHTHQRAQSPPGFWRTDMPDTQEEEDDLEAAKKLEREKVEERYREAMRPGGLWTWADE